MSADDLPRKGFRLLSHVKNLLFGSVSGIRREDALRIFRRDHYKCQYCGLDGLQRFENWLVLTIDHVQPQARGGPRTLANLVTACQPCNTIKGRHLFKSMEDARKYVLTKREHWEKYYLGQVRAWRATATAHRGTARLAGGST